jgi:hypothetical protein
MTRPTNHDESLATERSIGPQSVASAENEMPAAGAAAHAHHRRTGSNENLLQPNGEATHAPDDIPVAGEEEPEILEILARQNAPPILLSLPEESTVTEWPPAQPLEVVVDIVTSAPSKSGAPELPMGSPRRSSSFDRRFFPMLLCVSCLCCTLLAFVLVALWGGAQGAMF